MASARDLYFAYGSNLARARMCARVASARVVGPARLPDFRLAVDKHGRDGSGKANLHAQPGAWVWGVVYSIEAVDWSALDGYERGYARLEVRLEAQEPLVATTYASRLRAPEPVAFDWYKQLILDGAREHGLPEEWIAHLDGLPARPDPGRSG